MKSSADKQFQEFDVESWIVRRLDQQTSRNGVESPYRRIFEGVTDRETRKERIRDAIARAKLDVAIIGKNPSGKPETYAQIFERFYGEPLYRKGRGKAP